MKFRQVIIWGHPLHTNTFSYVQSSFYKAFKRLGYEAHWLDNTPENAQGTFDNCLFLTESQVDSHMPVVKGCKYVLHNCDQARYAEVQDDVLLLQVFSLDCIGRDERINRYTYMSPDGKCLYQPWATDLLPDEIDIEIDRLGKVERERTVHWVGTIGEGRFGNKPEIGGFKRACDEQGIGFKKWGRVSDEDHMNYIRRSYVAPQICGSWQVDNGYIPCRIFKNISYGQHGITNAKVIQDLFDGQLIYNPDTYQLFHDAEEQKDKQDLKALMEAVRDEHTYINRIERILSVLEQR